MGIAASHISEVLNQRMGNEEEVGCIFMIQTGNQFTFSGEGNMFNKFKQDRKIPKFAGLDMQAKCIYDRNFEDAFVSHCYIFRDILQNEL